MHATKTFSKTLFLFFAVSGVASAQDAPPPGSVGISGFVYGGSGCPQGSAISNLSPDGKALTVIFDNYIVEAEPDGDDRKGHCSVRLSLDAPEGWTYTLFSVDYRGFAELPRRGGKARLRSWYSLPGADRRIRISNQTMEGPYSNDYHIRAGVPLDALPWMACDQRDTTVIIDTEIKVEGRQAIMSVDSMDGEFRQEYGIAWRRCSNSSRWVSSCQTVLETVWGTNFKEFRADGVGTDHQSAKMRAEQRAHAQCQQELNQFRGLARALFRCVTHESQCVARPQ